MLFSELVFEQACPSHRFLEEMNRTVPRDIFESSLSSAFPEKQLGRRPYNRLLLFKMHLLQVWFGLSDRQTSFQCEDRLSFRKFSGLKIDDNIPESTTLENFRHELQQKGLDTGLMEKLDAFFKSRGLLLKEGNMVDASFIQANSQPGKSPEEQSDIDAEWGHKGFGYSATANVDRKTKLIRRINTTSERPHDSQQLEPVLVGDETSLYADSGYLGNKPLLEERGIQPYILKKRVRGKKGEPTPPLPLRDKYKNRIISKSRAPVEHIFACWKTVFKLTRAWYRGLERVNQQIQSLAIGYNLRRYGYLSRA